jgi:hypothetical protein
MTPNSPSLANLIGKKISIKIPLWKADTVLWVTLVGVEAGGIWIESDDFMEQFFAETAHTMTPVSMQIFVPYYQILAIYHPGGGPWISEKVAE